MRSGHLRFSAPLALILLLLAAGSVRPETPADAEAAVGTLCGRISIEHDGAPLPDVALHVYDRDGNLQTRMTTDRDGLISTPIPAGRWRLMARAEAYDPVEAWYTVYRDAKTTFSFEMSDEDGNGGYALGDTLSVIQRPLMNIPQIVCEGDTFIVNCLADPGTDDWSAALYHDALIVPLELLDATHDPLSTWWDLQVRVPESILNELYDLRVTADNGIDDTTRHSVQVIEAELDDFYFLQISDTHLPTHRMYYHPAAATDTSEIVDLRSIIQDAQLINPAFVLHTGDLIQEGELEDYLGLRYYSRSQQVLEEFGVPLYLIAGNHDLGSWESREPPAGTARRDWWRFYGWSILDDPPPGMPLRTQNYSFDYGGVHFSAMESYENYDLWRVEHYGTQSFTSPQLQWLQSDLNSASGSLAQVLFYHYDFSDDLDLGALGVDMALWGHVHADTGSLESPPYDLSVAEVCDFVRGYRLVRVVNGVLDPRPGLQAGEWGANLDVTWSSANDGSANRLTAWINNAFAERFQHGRLIFEMPKSEATRIVVGGVLSQIDTSGETDKWYVDVDIKAAGITEVTAKLESHTGVDLPPVETLALYANHPNPFNPITTLSYFLPSDGHARLSIFDLRGHEIALLVDDRLGAGRQSVVWDGRDRNGVLVSSGTYMVQLRAVGEVRNRKISLAR